MSAIDLIASERLRQITSEGWTHEHDDKHDRGQLADAAAAYTQRPHWSGFPPMWPWDPTWWKPTPNDRIRELVKAGALIVAEIERLQRVAARARPDGEQK